MVGGIGERFFDRQQSPPAASLRRVALVDPAQICERLISNPRLLVSKEVEDCGNQALVVGASVARQPLERRLADIRLRAGERCGNQSDNFPVGALDGLGDPALRDRPAAVGA